MRARRRQNSQFATAADTLDIEGLIRELDAQGANSRIDQPFCIRPIANDNGLRAIAA